MILYCGRRREPIHHDLESVVGLHQCRQRSPSLSEGDYQLANVNSLVTTVYMADEDEKTIGLHSRCHTFFSPREGELEEHMKMLLDYFFDMHNVIKDNMNQLGQAAINEEEKKERVKVKGFSAYKDNTMPIEAKKEEEKKE